MINTDRVKGVVGQVNIDGVSPYSFEAKLPMDSVAKTQVFKPKLVVNIEGKDYTIQGELSNKGGSQMDLEINTNILTTDPLFATRKIS